MIRPEDSLTPDHLPAWHREALEALTFPLGWKPGTDPESWKRVGREAFRALLLEEAPALDSAPQVLAEERRAGYRVQHIELTLGRFRRTGALLAIPDGPGPFPAALVLHDHGAFFEIGKEKMLRPLAGHPKSVIAADWAERNYDGVFVGDELARLGWVVLSTDALGWGDRAVAGYEHQQALASNLLGLGSSWAGLIAVEDAAAARFLAALPQVDPARVASVGHSMGSFRSWQLNALSDDIRACVAICSFGTLSGLMVPGGNRARGQSAFTMTHPGLARLMDFPDVAALGAPKPLLMIHGRDDKLCPVPTVQEAYDKTAQVYQAFGQPGAFHGEFRSGGHAFTRDDQKKAWSWLAGVLPVPPFSTVLS